MNEYKISTKYGIMVKTNFVMEPKQHEKRIAKHPYAPRIFAHFLLQNQVHPLKSGIIHVCAKFDLKQDVLVKHGCPRRQQSKSLKYYILTPTNSQGQVMSVCEKPLHELTVQVRLLYYHTNFK